MQGRPTMLKQSVFADITSVTDFGILLGALSGAALLGTFRFRPLGSLSQVVGAALGVFSLAMAPGCRIDATWALIIQL